MEVFWSLYSSFSPNSINGEGYAVAAGGAVSLFDEYASTGKRTYLSYNLNLQKNSQNDSAIFSEKIFSRKKHSKT